MWNWLRGVATTPKGIEVRPRRWWWPPNRRAARLAAAVLAHDEDEVFARVERSVAHALIFGEFPHGC